MANVLLKLTGNRDEAAAVVDEQIEQNKKFQKEGSVEAVLRVNADEAKAEVAELLAEMKAIPKEETILLRVEQIGGEQAKLDSLMARKAGLEKQLQDAQASGQDTDGLTKRLGSYASRIQTVQGRIVSLATDFEKLGQDGEQDVSKVTRVVGGLTTGLTRARTGAVSFVSELVGHIPLIGGLFSKIAEGVGSLATTLLPEAAEGAGGLVASFAGLVGVAPILLVIVAAVAALVVSLGEALIGIVALGVAFLAALVPIIAVLGLVLVKIKDIVSGQQTLATANANLKSAIDSQKQAVTELHQAEQTESTTRIAAIAAERQAYDAELDAINQVNDARLGVQSAKLQLQQARLTLAEFKQELAGLGTSPGDLFGGSQNVSESGNFGQTQSGSSPFALQSILLQYKQDLLDVKTGAQGTKDAVGQLRDAITNQVTVGAQWAEYLKLGLKAFPQYASAVNAVVTAQDNLKRADDQLAAAELAKSQAIRHGASEASAFEKAYKDLKRTLGVVFGPAEAAVFAGIEKALGIMAKGLKPLEPAFLALGKAIGGAFVWWAQMMTKPENMKLLVGLIQLAAGLTKTMSHWLGSAFKFAILIAKAAGPSLLAMIGHWAKELSHANLTTKSIHNFVTMCIDKATTFWHVLLKIAGVLGKIASLTSTIAKVFGVVSAPAKFLGHGLGNVAGELVNGSGVNQVEQLQTAMQQSKLVSTWEKALKTGMLNGKRVTAATESFLLNSLTGAGVKYKGPVAAVAGGGTHVGKVEEHHHYAQPVGDHDHFARAIRKSIVGQGGVR